MNGLAPAPRGLQAVVRLRGGDRWLSCAALALGAAVLGRSLQLSNGTVNDQAIYGVTLALGMGALALAALRLPFVERRGEGVVTFVLAFGLLYEFGAHLVTSAGSYLGAGTDYVDHHFAIAGAAVLSGTLLSRAPWLGRVAFPALLGVHLWMGSWLLKASPTPFIDVFVWTNEALANLKAGNNPYAGTMPNIYGHTIWFSPGMADNQRVYMGYTYPPLSLLLGWVAKLFSNDYRYANLCCLTGAGALMAYSRPGRLGPALAALFLFTPRVFFVLEQAWTDSYVVFLLALTVFLACRRPKWTPYAFGLLMVSKQYSIVLGPLALLLLPTPLRWRDFLTFTWKAAAVGLAVTAPLALWDYKVFLTSVVVHSGDTPFRPEALSYVAWTAKNGAPTLPGWLNLAMLLPVYGLAFLRGARTPAGFAIGCSLAFGVLFAFSKHAFCNHWFLMLGCLACAAAAMLPEGAAPVPLQSRAAEPAV